MSSLAYFVFDVVFGTMVLQGLTIVPLIRPLGIKPDDSLRPSALVIGRQAAAKVPPCFLPDR
jgi:NhaP-type Na+/H+ or K+/H+ antiporter